MWNKTVLAKLGYRSPRYIPGNDEENHEQTPVTISGLQGPELNPGPPDYEIGVL